MREWPILELHETIRVSYVVVCSIVFILFYDRDVEEGVLKHMKNDHLLVFLAVWVLFSLVVGQVKEWLILKFQEIIRVQHEVACSIRFYFDLWSG